MQCVYQKSSHNDKGRGLGSDRPLCSTLFSFHSLFKGIFSSGKRLNYSKPWFLCLLIWTTLLNFLKGTVPETE